MRKIDLACGASCREGFEGVDIAPCPGVKHVHNLLSFPWPFEDASVDEISCSHFIEHIPELFWTAPEKMPGNRRNYTFDELLSPVQLNEHSVDLFLKFFDEVHRILKPGGKAVFACPFLKSERAFQDPTHRRFITPKAFLYLDREQRKAWRLEHGAYGISCHFPMKDVQFNWTYPDGGQDAKLRHPDAVAAMVDRYWNVVDDLIALLLKPAAPQEPQKEAAETRGAGAADHAEGASPEAQRAEEPLGISSGAP